MTRPCQGVYVAIALGMIVGALGCSSSNPAQPTTPTTPAPTPPAQPSISSPTPVSPINGIMTTGWPTFTVIDAQRSAGTSNALVYRFDVSTSPTFATNLVTATVSETPGQTTYTPPSTTAAPPQNGLYWRVVAIDPINIAASAPSAAQTFTWGLPPSVAATLAAQEGLSLWSGPQPPGTTGHAVMGNGWGIGTPLSFTGVVFTSPQLDQLQIFDLLDRGLDPQAAIDWMHANGYATQASWYPSVAVIGFQYSYMALIAGGWNIVIKVGA